MADSFFISYTGADRDWAEWIAWTLEEAGYPCRVQAWDFGAGSNFVSEMHRSAVECGRTLAVLTEAYLKSAFAESEWVAAFADDPGGTARKLVPVRVAPCNPRGLLRSIVYIDLVGLDEATATSRLLTALGSTGRGKPPVKPAFPTPSTKPVFPVPSERDSAASLRRELQELITIIDDLEDDRDVDLAGRRLGEWKKNANAAVKRLAATGVFSGETDLYSIHPDPNLTSAYNKLKNEARKCQKFLGDLILALES